VPDYNALHFAECMGLWASRGPLSVCICLYFPAQCMKAFLHDLWVVCFVVCLRILGLVLPCLIGFLCEALGGGLVCAIIGGIAVFIAFFATCVALQGTAPTQVAQCAFDALLASVDEGLGALFGKFRPLLKKFLEDWRAPRVSRLVPGFG